MCAERARVGFLGNQSEERLSIKKKASFYKANFSLLFDTLSKERTKQ